MGCHGCNLFEWSDARAAGTLIYGGLPGSEESLEDGSTVTVKVYTSYSLWYCISVEHHHLRRAACS